MDWKYVMENSEIQKKEDYSETDLSRCLFCKDTGNVKSLKLLLQENLFKNK